MTEPVALRAQVSARLQAASTLLRAGRFDLAEGQLREALALDPGLAVAHADLALCLFERGLEDDALRESDAAVAAAPDDHHSYHSRAYILLGMSRYRRALEAVDADLRLAPTCSFGLVQRSAALRLTHRHQLALEAAEAALSLRPQSVDALNAKALALICLGRHDEADAVLRVALSLDPNAWASMNNLGITHVMRDNLAEAVGLYREAARLDPSQHIAVNNFEATSSAARQKAGGLPGLPSVSMRTMRGVRFWWGRQAWWIRVIAVLLSLAASFAVPALRVVAAFGIWWTLLNAIEPRLERRWATKFDRAAAGYLDAPILIVVPLFTAAYTMARETPQDQIDVWLGLLVVAQIMIVGSRAGRERLVALALAVPVLVALPFLVEAFRDRGDDQRLLVLGWLIVVGVTVKAGTIITFIARRLSASGGGRQVEPG